MKRVFVLFLSLILCLSSLCEIDGVAFAATTTFYTYGDYTYTIISSYKKTAKITKYSGKEVNIDIPELLDDTYTVTEIGSNCFTSNLTKVINVSQYVKSMEPLAFCCDFLEAITVDENNEYYASLDGVLYSKDMKTLVRFPVAFSGESFSIPFGVEKIGDYAFRGPVSSSNAPADLQLEFSESITEVGYRSFYGSYISELKLPESVITIGGEAFLNANAKYLYIGGNVETMGSDLFCTCSGTTYSPLKTIEVSEENEIFSSKDNVLFGNFGHDLIFYPRTKKNKSYIVPDSVTTIKECAFSFLSMDCIDLNNVEKLESNAFFNVSIDKYIISEELNKFYTLDNGTKFEIVSLNPNCSISFHTYSWDNYNVKIYGFIGSTAESFVNERSSDQLKLTFISIDGESIDDCHLPKPVSFGTYPQKKVVSSSLVSKLNALDLQWKSYGYYSGTGKMDSQEKSDYMQYTDVVYNGQKYRGVKFSQYRPIRSYLTATENYSYQDDNGYFTDNIYWFKYEPIEWNILDKAKGLIVSSVALDSQSFCDDALVYSNDYSESTIRIWLNNDFYNNAFTDEEKALINSTKLEDSNIFDKIFLLSYDDMLNTDFGFTSNTDSTSKRYCVGSDYAQCQGLMVKTNTNVNDYYENNTNWILRTAGTAYDLICNATVEGKLAQNHNIFNSDGIRPSMCLSTICNTQETIICEHSTTKLVGYQAPTCSKGGYSGDLICVSCGQIIETGIITPVTSHTYTVKEAVEATCTEYGQITYACSACKNEKVEQLEMKAHSIVIDERIDPSCTQAGMTQGSHCSVCNQVIEQQNIIEATGHTVVIDNEVKPTYSTTGLSEGSHCTICNCVITQQQIIPALVCNHNSTKLVVIKKATFSENGNSKIVCADCGKVISTNTNKAIKSVSLSKASLTYSGKTLTKPAVTVKDSSGNKISSHNYTVTYISRSTGKSISSIKSIGQYKVKITFKGKYSGTKYLYFTVKPKTNTVKALTTSKNTVTAKWSKDTSVTGYQLVIATDSKFTKNKKIIKISNNSTYTYKFKNLKKGKRYYVKVRPYKNIKVDGKGAVVYGSYSSAKSIVCK